MSELQLILGSFAQFWRAFTDLQHPLLHISFAQLIIGIFVVSLALKILWPLLGIGLNNLIKDNRRKEKKPRREDNT